MNAGWMGLKQDVLHTLMLANADRDTDGRFLVSGTVISGLGGEEVVIDASALYYVLGRAYGLAALMNNTAYGLHGITVL